MPARHKQPHDNPCALPQPRRRRRRPHGSAPPGADRPGIRIKAPHRRPVARARRSHAKRRRGHRRRQRRALRDIIRYQKSGDLLIPRHPFGRLVREMTNEIAPGVHMRREAMQAIQEAAESYLVGLFTDAQLAAVHRNRITIAQKDLNVVRRLRGDMDIFVRPHQ